MQRQTLFIMGLATALVGGLAVQPASADFGDLFFAHDDGPYLYDADADCVGDSNQASDGVALQHWHVGLPVVGAEAEIAGGFGCKGGPRSFDFTIPGEKHERHGLVAGTVTYAWDENVGGGGGNEVHIHIFDAGTGELVTSTIFTQDPNPVVPGVLDGPREHAINFVLEPGSYELVEDVWSGQHTAWVTSFTVTEIPA